MARLPLNKSSLVKQIKALDSYSRFLPSLELKRQQLKAALNDTRASQKNLERELRNLYKTITTSFPMASTYQHMLTQIIDVDKIETDTEYLAGLRLPILKTASFSYEDTSFRYMQHWVEDYIDHFEKAIVIRIKQALLLDRISILNTALIKVTQRFNLFEKVLIPETKRNIKKIKIYLADEQMAEVVRSKLAKKKRLAQKVNP